MCLFFSYIRWHKPTPYFKVACNQFGFGMILKSKDQLSISDTSDGSSTPLLNYKIFKKWPKMLLLGVSTPFFLKTWSDGKCSCSARKMPSETPGTILFTQKVQICRAMLLLWLCVTCLFCCSAFKELIRRHYGSIFCQPAELLSAVCVFTRNWSF